MTSIVHVLESHRRPNDELLIVYLMAIGRGAKVTPDALTAVQNELARRGWKQGKILLSHPKLEGEYNLVQACRVSTSENTRDTINNP